MTYIVTSRTLTLYSLTLQNLYFKYKMAPNYTESATKTQMTDCIVKGFVKRRNDSTIVTAFRHVVTVAQNNAQIQSPQNETYYFIIISSKLSIVMYKTNSKTTTMIQTTTMHLVFTVILRRA